MEDYRLPAPLVGMLKATNLSGMPHVQTDLRTTKISVTITWDLATSAPKKPKKQPAKKKPSETSAPTRHQLQTSQCPPPETPTLPSPTPATIVRRQVTAPSPSPTAPPVTKKPRREPLLPTPTSAPTPQPETKPTPAAPRRPFAGEFKVRKVKSEILRTNYTNHRDKTNYVREYCHEKGRASIQALRPKTGPRHTHYLVSDFYAYDSTDYYLLTYKDTPEYDHYKRLWQQGEKLSSEFVNDWNYFCSTVNILELRPPEATS